MTVKIKIVQVYIAEEWTTKAKKVILKNEKTGNFKVEETKCCLIFQIWF
jgi:hypothetical protein